MIIPESKPFSSMSILSSFTIEELENVILDNPSLRGYLQGYLSEIAMKKLLLEIEGVEEVSKIPDQSKQKGDLSVTYKGEILTIEVKSVSTASVKYNPLTDTWKGSVSFKSSDKRDLEVKGMGIISTCAIVKGGFDILAISTYAVNNNWEFLFIENDYLPELDLNLPGLVPSRLSICPVSTPCVTSDLKQILDDAREKKLLSKSFLSV